MAVCCVFLSFVAAMRLAAAAPLQEARVSQVIQDVRLLEENAAPRPAVLNDKVTLRRAVRTGVKSRAELTFTDLTITRLGANTIFSLEAGAREVELTKGTILIEVPSKAAPVKASTAAVTVAVMGGTALLGTGPPIKFMVLEGTCTMYPKGHPEKAVTVHGGEMVMATADGHITQPTEFDVKLVVETSHLIVDFPPLTNLPLILAVVDQQLAEQQLAGATTQPLFKNLVDVIDVTDQNANANPIVLAARGVTPTPTPPPPTPTPTPSKFGPPSVIASPVPYLITSGTVITTDPTITTNNVTDFGKIYRNPTDDGPFTTYAFSSTSSFDTALKLDASLSDPTNLPIAVFKFQGLSLVGNPTIDLGSGGATKLALIAVDGITSGPPGGSLTFTGLDTLGLFTVAGSINLTSDISFDGVNLLFIYARGAGSNLTLASPILNSDNVFLAAEGSMNLMVGITAAERLKFVAGGDLVTTGPGGSAEFELDNIGGTITGTKGDRGNITLEVGGSLSSQSLSLLLANNAGGNISGTGGNISVTTGGDVTTSGDATFTIQNTTGTINDGGNLTLDVGGNLVTHAFSLLIENYDFTANAAGHIGNGGNLSLTTGGNFTADSASIAINNRGGGTIDSSASISVNIGGALTTLKNGLDFLGNPTSFEIDLATRFDNQNGNTKPSAVGGDATVNVQADSASIGGLFDATLSDRGGSIGGNALLSFNTTHDTKLLGVDTTIGTASFEAAAFALLNDSGPPVNGADTPLGGNIQGDATLQISTANLSVPNGSLDVLINNQNRAVTGGTIGGSAIVDISASAISVANDFGAEIQNGRGNDATGSGGGSIGTNAALNIVATSLSVGGELDVDITNGNNGSGSSTGGSIGGKATINLNIANTLSTGGAANFQILNNDGGHIGGDANILVTTSAGGDFMANSILALINNSNGGMIGGAANVAVNVTNDVTAPGGVTLQILNGNGSHIGTGTVGDGVFYSAGGSTSTTNLTEYVDNENGGVIDNGGNVTLHTVGPVMLDGGLLLEVDNFNGGTINNGANITAHFVGDVTATLGSGHSLNFNIVNGSGFGSFQAPGGTIGTGGNINVAFDGNAEAMGTSTTGAFAADIYNGLGSITTGGNISVTVGGNLTCGNILSIATDNTGGHIGTGGHITLDVIGDITSVGSQGAVIELVNNGGTIGSGQSINVSAANINTPDGGAYFQILNNNDGSGGGAIASDATLNVNVGSITGAHPGANALVAQIDNRGGSIGSNATVNLAASGNVNAQDNAFLQVLNFNDGASGPGTIGGDVTLNISAASISTDGFLHGAIDNSNGGSITGSADVTFNLTGDLTTQGDANFAINNSNGGTIGGDATITVNANNISAGGSFSAGISSSGDVTGGRIATGASVNLTVGGNLTAGPGGLDLFIDNQPGTIGTDANIFASIGGNVAAGQFAGATIFNTGGIIGSNAVITTNIMGDLTADAASFGIYNFGGGTIGSSAGVTINIGGDLVVAGDAEFFIWNYGLAQGIGSIGQNAFIDVNLTGDLNAQGTADFEIINSNGGGNAIIGGDATINVGAANVTANSLVAQIDNTGGSIGASTEGGATINMNVSGTATVTNDATFEILGSDGAASAAINFNGGSYDVGGTFLAETDGDGMITFNNASAHANVLQVGALGTYGVLNIGGGTLSADTTLKLYAPGSNGQLNFLSNVTLGGTAAKILAANSVSIFNGVVVTIGGSTPADVYTGFTGEIPNANYTGFGGNGSTTGTFAGAGANSPQPLSSAPPFSDPPATPTVTSATSSSTTSTKISSTTLSGSKTTSTKATSATINVSSTAELLSLLDGASVGPDGKAIISGSKSTSNLKNLNGANLNGLARGDRHALIQQVHDRDTNRVGGRRIL